MIVDWIDHLACTWGWQWRLLLSQDVGGARSWWATLIEKDSYPEGHGERLMGDALRFHRAFVTLRVEDRVILANHYIDPLPVKTKAPALGIAERTWWQRLHRSHEAARAALEDVQNVHMHERKRNL